MDTTGTNTNRKLDINPTSKNKPLNRAEIRKGIADYMLDNINRLNALHRLLNSLDHSYFDELRTREEVKRYLIKQLKEFMDIRQVHEYTRLIVDDIVRTTFVYGSSNHEVNTQG